MTDSVTSGNKWQLCFFPHCEHRYWNAVVDLYSHSRTFPLFLRRISAKRTVNNECFRMVLYPCFLCRLSESLPQKLQPKGIVFRCSGCGFVSKICALLHCIASRRFRAWTGDGTKDECRCRIDSRVYEFQRKLCQCGDLYSLRVCAGVILAPVSIIGYNRHTSRHLLHLGHRSSRIFLRYGSFRAWMKVWRTDRDLLWWATS